jgi:hypothetical protein
MSKAPAFSTAPDAQPFKIIPETDAMPTLEGRPAVVAYAASIGLRVTERYVREETRTRNLRRFIIANKCWYSRADVRAWLDSKRDA